MCLRVSWAILSGLQEKLTFRCQQISHEHRALYRLIVDVPAKHLNLFKTNPSLDLYSLSLVVEGTFVVWIFPLQYSPYSVVYDPTAFMACKLVIVAWLKAYGAAMKPRAPCGTAATCDAARHALVSRLLTKYLYQVTSPYRFYYKIFSLKTFKCSNGKSTMDWENSVL